MIEQRKKTLQDVIPGTTRQIRKMSMSAEDEDSIRVPEKRKRVIEESLREFERSRVSQSYTDTKKSRFPEKMLWLVCGLCFLAFIFSLLSLFSGAKITISQRMFAGDIQADLIANKASTSPDSLTYTLVDIIKDTDVFIAGTKETTKETKAGGIITISNSYSETPQRLIKNTRFETSKGLIYKIDKSIVVPGKKIVDGSITPGTIDVQVYAEAPGVEYNTAFAEFTIPGFKGKPSFSGFSARTKTALSGGFLGKTKVVSETEKAEALANATVVVRSALNQDTSKNTPAGYGAFANNTEVTIADPIYTDAEGGLSLHLTGTARTYFFEEKSIALAITKKKLSGFANEPVSLSNFSDIAFAKTSLTAKGELHFSLKGNARILWDIDQKKLKNDLAGVSKKDVNTILAHHPGVEKAEIVISPFWKSTFPKDSEKITLEIRK